MPDFQLTPAILTMIAGVVLSLAFSYIPGLNVKFAALPGEIKRLIMLLLLLLTAATIFVMGCTGILQAGLTCDKDGFWTLVYIFILAVIANQSAYAITPLPASVKLARWKD